MKVCVDTEIRPDTYRVRHVNNLLGIRKTDAGTGNPSERPPRANLIITSGRSPGLQAGKYPKICAFPWLTQWLVQIVYLFTVAGAAQALFAVKANSPTSCFNSKGQIVHEYLMRFLRGLVYALNKKLARLFDRNWYSGVCL